MFKYTPDFLVDYSDDSLLAELRRVAQLCEAGALTAVRFEKLSAAVSASTIRRRFGGWREALERAELPYLYSGQKVTEKMKKQLNKGLSNEHILHEIVRAHQMSGGVALTRNDFRRHAKFHEGLVTRRFGSWTNALQAANVGAYQKPRTFTEIECFENLAAVWERYGRSPNFREMFKPPSSIQAKTYVLRWGTWRKAKQAFVEWADLDGDITEKAPSNVIVPIESPSVVRDVKGDSRDVRPGLRFKVLHRDRFRCITCGRSPATHIEVHLHVDHIQSVANGGRTVIENLQSLCQDCNLGKGRTSL